MKREMWLCTKADLDSFTIDKKYTVDSEGYLYDNYGGRRQRPLFYNNSTTITWYKFEKVLVSTTTIIGGELC